MIENIASLFLILFNSLLSFDFLILFLSAVALFLTLATIVRFLWKGSY